MRCGFEMKMRCLACGVEKDTSVKEVYPFPEDGMIEEPVEPLFGVECQGSFGKGWRMAIVCHTCLHKLAPDMWISEQCWLNLNPITPFEQLPTPSKDANTRFVVETYAACGKTS